MDVFTLQFRMEATGMRMPLMHGFPKHFSGSSVTRSNLQCRISMLITPLHSSNLGEAPGTSQAEPGGG